ncbi:ABC transporter ATP-binding protein [Candidatus Pelagibacter ubique]|nr:ABC transporter ATP-binding protein [Candidatus Pelagibacter ubique]
MKIIKKILFLLTPREKKSAGLLFLMILFMAIIDMIGVASILPFIAILTNPTLIEANVYLNKFFQISFLFGVRNYQEFLFFSGLLVLILLVTSLFFKAITIYAQVRFTEMRHYSISKRLVESYLQQPYSWFLNQNSSEIGKTVLSEVNNVVANGLSQLLEVIAKGSVAIAIIILLIAVNPMLAFVVGFVISFAYGLIFFLLANYLKRLGEKRLLHNELRYKTISEAFNATKEVKIGGLEKSFTKLFSRSALIYARTSTSADVIKQLPRFFLEAIVFGGILLIILYIMSKTGNFNTALPIVSLYVFAGYRLMPALQQIYASLTIIKFIEPSLNKLYEDMKGLDPLIENQKQGILPLKKSIVLKNINYNYPNSSRTSLKNLNMIIPANSTVGFIGTTGSGKTTTADIILGLLEPQKGTLQIDGEIITKQNVRAWQRSIGYVPQYIYLSDDTVEANIAFGVESKDIDFEAIEKASKIANLHEFVLDELPFKYQTIIGEDGVRLSGGQRQRIGIARALYNNPKVLILDEATSALDNETEKGFMELINNFNKNITIIIIAHRLNTLKDCDIIFKLEKGQVVDQGKFSEIIGKLY